MKQCIMSESRFDFLRELVKNVPDINVAEEQLAADNYPDAGESSDTSSPCQMGGEPSVQRLCLPSGSGQNGNIITNKGRNGTGTKRANSSGFLFNPTDYETGSRSGVVPTSQRSDWKITKQHSLDMLQGSSTRNQNFYTERLAGETAENVAIDYSVRDRSDGSRPPKLSRIDSAPASILSNNSASSLGASCYVSTTTSPSSGQQPIINFDFTKVPFLPLPISATTTATSPSPFGGAGLPSHTGHSSTIPELMPLNVGGAASSTAPLLNLPVPSIAVDPLPRHSHSITGLLGSSTATETTGADKTASLSTIKDPQLLYQIHPEVHTKSIYCPPVTMTALSHTIQPPAVNVDLTASPLVKINYSNMHFSQFQQPNSPTNWDRDHPITQPTSSSSQTSTIKAFRSVHPTSNTTTKYLPSRPHISVATPPEPPSKLKSTQQHPQLLHQHQPSQSIQPPQSIQSHKNIAPSSSSTFQQPVLNINLTNHLNNAAPSFSYSIPSTTVTPSSSSLDMDEDYDDI